MTSARSSPRSARGSAQRLSSFVPEALLNVTSPARQSRGVAELGLRWPKTDKKAQHQYQLPIRHSGCMSPTRRWVLAAEALELTILSGHVANHHVLPDCAFVQRPPGSSRAQ
jgi:hypothetical protein